jgi:hypothetical protein
MLTGLVLCGPQSPAPKRPFFQLPFAKGSTPQITPISTTASPKTASTPSLPQWAATLVTTLDLANPSRVPAWTDLHPEAKTTISPRPYSLVTTLSLANPSRLPKWSDLHPEPKATAGFPQAKLVTTLALANPSSLPAWTDLHPEPKTTAASPKAALVTTLALADPSRLPAWTDLHPEPKTTAATLRPYTLVTTLALADPSKLPAWTDLHPEPKTTAAAPRPYTLVTTLALADPSKLPAWTDLHPEPKTTAAAPRPYTLVTTLALADPSKLPAWTDLHPQPTIAPVAPGATLVTTLDLADPSKLPHWTDLYPEPPAPRITAYAPGAQSAPPRAEWGATLVTTLPLAPSQALTRSGGPKPAEATGLPGGTIPLPATPPVVVTGETPAVAQPLQGNTEDLNPLQITADNVGGFILHEYPPGTWVNHVLVRPNGHLLLTLFDRPEVHTYDPSKGDTVPPVVAARLPDNMRINAVTEFEADKYAVLATIPGEEANRRATLFVLTMSGTPDGAPRLEMRTVVEDAESIVDLVAINSTTLLAASEGTIHGIGVRSGLNRPLWTDPTMIPGINAVKFRPPYVYYVNGQAGRFARLPFDLPTLEALAPAEVIVDGVPGITDVALAPWTGTEGYLLNFEQNMISRVNNVAAVDTILTGVRGPTSAAFGRLAGTSKTLYVVTGAPPGTVAKILAVTID